MNKPIRLVALSGSLRKESFNTKLLLNALELLPEGVTAEVAPFADLPVYNGDMDLPLAKERPATVTAFREALAKADGILIASPEYNYSIPGGLKNAIDWASRGEDAPLLHKPVALIGTTPGMWGTSRMQLAFNAVFQFLDMRPVYKPEVLIADAKNKFDGEGRLIDEKARDLVRRKLQALKELILQMAKEPA
jgi:chromate reductase, NAD(P)H dehydrogenase (quinone)